MRIQLRNTLLLVLALTVGLAGASAIAGKRKLRPNPANDPVLVKKKIDPNRYDGAAGCVKKHPKGMRKLIRWMKRNTKKKTIYGTVRCDGGVHSTGRALDWMLDARKKRQKRKAMKVINTWVSKDKRGRNNALARRMGIQLIIYNCRWWQAGDRGWQRYSACSGGKKNADPTQGHIDHIHVELTKPASKLRTSFWKYGTSGKGGGGGGSGGGVSPNYKSATASGRSGIKVRPPLHPPEHEHMEAHLHE
ncbi:MAG TPA: hypothetical protein VKA36_01220 [Solirubrobacterales bacterium]|nr:hypothetical protein [Solirubrobacterales bacterium]